MLLVVRLPHGRTEDAADFSDLYQDLPYQDLFPLNETPIEIDGTVRRIRLGLSQTGFNHPWRVEMVNSARSETAARFPVGRHVYAIGSNPDAARFARDLLKGLMINQCRADSPDPERPVRRTRGGHREDAGPLAEHMAAVGRGSHH